MATQKDSSDDWGQWSRYVVMTLQAQVKEAAEHREHCVKCREHVQAELAEIRKQVAINSLKLGFFCALLSAGVSIAIKYGIK